MAETKVDESTTLAASEPFFGKWKRLVSTSNWDKGRIIHDWRTALIEAKAPATEYSDETWSQNVGGVTSQHVGRLRRVYDRFGSMADQFSSLFWSHFQAALDWEDAEMWLEGASQNQWSVSVMRRQRWETTGAVETEEPKEEDIVEAELDEDFQEESAATEASSDNKYSDETSGEFFDSPGPTGPDFGDEDESPVYYDDDGTSATSDSAATATLVRPFEHLDELPEDFAEVLDAFKVSILRHKADEWNDLPLETVLACLDALKEMAKAPVGE